MKTLAIAAASLFTAFGPAAHAAYDRSGHYYDPNDYRDTAHVIETRPVYAAVGSQECWNTRNNRYEVLRDGRRFRQANGDFDVNNCRAIASNGETMQGYDVRYVYRGNEYTARMQIDPGQTLVLGREIREDGTPYDYIADNTRSAYNDPRLR
jgi:hypothetical protein